MIFASGTFTEFARFIQIVSWILLPVLTIAIFLTIITDRRRKKKKTHQLKLQADNADDVPGSFENQPPGAQLLFDHSGLIRQYRNKLSYNHARYTALKHDFEKLEVKYSAISIGRGGLSYPKNVSMENNVQEISLISNEEFGAAKQQWMERFEQLNRSYEKLEAENEALLEQIQLHSATDDEKVIVVNRWKEENQSLKTQVEEQGYLKDIIEEKKAQITFLQSQVDQRIMNFHQAERQRDDLKTGFSQLQDAWRVGAEELESIRSQVNDQREVIRQLQNNLSEKDALLLEKQQFLAAKLDHIVYVENLLVETKQQNEVLNAALADSHDLAANLRQQVQDEEARVTYAEQKLSANRQLLQHLYKEFSTCMETDVRTEA